MVSKIRPNPPQVSIHEQMLLIVAVVKCVVRADSVRGLHGPGSPQQSEGVGSVIAHLSFMGT